MAMPLVECIPNYSEGRRPEIIDQIEQFQEVWIDLKFGILLQALLHFSLILFYLCLIIKFN